jgi:2-amino-4-hydroxy-6-hydroxymethyldihydropteridine diphosphokinase
MPLPHRAFLTLGSNIDPEENLPAALAYLRVYFDVLQVAPVYETAPVGFQAQANFLNTACLILTENTPVQVKAILLDIERRLQRVRDPLNPSGPRTIDLDLVLWDDAIFDYGDKPWHIPDKDVALRAYIARPLADIAPDYVHPEQDQTLATLANRLDESDLRLRQDVNLS